MIRMKRLLTHMVAAVGLVSAVLVSAAWAGDVKVYPGHQCRPQLPQQLGDFQFDFGTGHIGHASGGRSRLVVCPIVRDVLVRAPKSVEVFVSGVASRRSVRCSVTAHSADGSQRRTRGGVIQGKSGAFKISNITSLSGAYSMRCRLDQGTRIIRYTVDE